MHRPARRPLELVRSVGILLAHANRHHRRMIQRLVDCRPHSRLGTVASLGANLYHVHRQKSAIHCFVAGRREFYFAAEYELDAESTRILQQVAHSLNIECGRCT